MKKNFIFWTTFNIVENHYINIKKKNVFLLMVGYRIYFCFFVIHFFSIYTFLAIFNFHKFKKKFKICI